MADYRITCIDKSHRMSAHEHITAAGGTGPDGNGWKDTTPNIIRFIENKQHQFYTQKGNATAWVGVRVSAAGNKYIQTYADGVWKDNLLALDECSLAQ